MTVWERNGADPVCMPHHPPDQKDHAVSHNIDPDKYIVFKREDFIDALGDVYGFSHKHDADDWIKSLHKDELKDAVVIRHRDVFAPSALYAYATSVLAALDIFESMERSAVVDPVVLEDMRHLADYFAGQADAARQSQSVLPSID